MTPDKQLKLIAIVLPEPLASYVREQQVFISETWGCRHALRTPPHITLIQPLKLTAPEYLIVESIVGEITQRQSSFVLNVNGFGAFKPRVIYIKPDLPAELKLLQSNLEKEISKSLPGKLDNDRSFHPHITLAHRDVKMELFPEMWRYFKNKELKLSVPIEEVSILDHTTKGWITNINFALESFNPPE